MAVVRLVVWCDHVPVEEYADELAAQGWAADQRDEALANAKRSLSFRVEEHAVLSDGRRLLLFDDRGWGTSGPADLWAGLTVDDVEQTARNVVLPDDAEQTGEQHPWEWLAARLGQLGVVTDADELRSVPYNVELSARLRRRLAGPV